MSDGTVQYDRVWIGEDRFGLELDQVFSGKPTQRDSVQFNRAGIGGLNLKALREANLKRLPLFKNAKGELAHSSPDGSDWSLNDWYTAVSGEVGELGNFLKKVRRGDFTLEEARAKIGSEIADIQIYLDILAMRCGVDLSEATCAKFNEVSTRVGCDVTLHQENT